MNTPNNTRDALAAEIRRLDALGLDWSHELDCLAALADDRAAGPEAARFAEPEGGTYAANEIVAAQWRVPPMTMFQRVGYPSEVADLVARARAVLAAQPEPIAAEPVNAVGPDDMRIGGHYNWKGQPERLAYLGCNFSGNGYWHQFEKITEPGKVWCEVKDSDLSRFEETGAAQPEPIAAEPVPMQGGLSNDKLMEAWQRKLPGVTPSDRELSAFAVGVEVGFEHARNLEKSDWSRVHSALKDAGVHPGRTDDHIADVIAAALATPAPELPADRAALAEEVKRYAMNIDFSEGVGEAAHNTLLFCAAVNALAAAPEAPAQPAGVHLPIDRLEDWKERVNTIAAMTLKADRYRYGSALKSEIASVIDAARITKPEA